MSSRAPDLEQRRLRPGDAGAAAELLYAFDCAHLEEVTDRLSPSDVLDWWRWYELPRDSIALASESLDAFGLLSRRDDGVLELQAFVHPGRPGRALRSRLVDWAEAEARSRGAPSLRAEIVPGDATARELVEERGYRPVRHGYRMVIDLEGPPVAAEWPAGFRVDVLREGEDRLLYEVMEEAFAEEWGRRTIPFEEWQENVTGAESFARSLCFLARGEGEVVAAETCAVRFGQGWVGAIGVRRAWRRRGLGRALLLHGFGELYRRGERRIGLGVDAANPTGATRLYEQVGMRVAWRSDTYERTL